MWTYQLSADGKTYNPNRCYDLEAVREWIRAAVQTARGEVPYLPPTYGIDIISIACSTNPKHYLDQSLNEICELRDDITLVSSNCWYEGRVLYATAEFKTIYGDVKLDNMLISNTTE